MGLETRADTSVSSIDIDGTLSQHSIGWIGILPWNFKFEVQETGKFTNAASAYFAGAGSVCFKRVELIDVHIENQTDADCAAALLRSPAGEGFLWPVPLHFGVSCRRDAFVLDVACSGPAVCDAHSNSTGQA